MKTDTVRSCYASLQYFLLPSFFLNVVYLPHNHIPPHSPRRCESKVKEKRKKKKVQIPSMKKDGNIFFYDDNKRSKNTSVRLFFCPAFSCCCLFPLFFFSLFLAVAIHLFFFFFLLGLMEKERDPCSGHEPTIRSCSPCRGQKRQMKQALLEVFFLLFCSCFVHRFTFLFYFVCIYIDVSSTYICAGCKVLERFPSRIHIFFLLY